MGEAVLGSAPTYEVSGMVEKLTTYGTNRSTADALGHLDAIKDDSSGTPGSSLAEYQYLGGRLPRPR